MVNRKEAAVEGGCNANFTKRANRLPAAAPLRADHEPAVHALCRRCIGKFRSVKIAGLSGADAFWFGNRFLFDLAQLGENQL